MYMNPNPAAGFSFLFGLPGVLMVVWSLVEHRYFGLIWGLILCVLALVFLREAIKQQRWIRQMQREHELGR